jgi:D-glycero-D-manno-heptose 1,7-bisphosphate phosphatase
MGRVKAVFLDRDGTISIDKNHIYKIEDFELIPSSLEALRLLTQHGIKIYIITNQAGIAKGYYTEEQFHSFNKFMLNYFEGEGVKIEKVLYCPHHPDGVIPQYTLNCNCRKPNTGLIEEILELGNIRPNETVLIGDKNSDIDAGYKMGITTYLVLTGYGMEHMKDTKANFIKDDLLSAVKHALNRETI